MTNYFELFQLPSQLPVDLAQLTMHYQQLQRQYHPDNFATTDNHVATESDKAAVMQKSALINDGYRILKDPVKAAEHWLLLQGIELNAEQDIIHDTDFLMEQFTLREQLDEIAQDAAQVDDFYLDVKQRKQCVYQQLLHDLQQKMWSAAQQQLYKIRYLDRLIEQIEMIQEAADN
ncbi:Fe-S protein assembly co-chaperone HscB [Orbaceae bacterium ESL0727]|nr:Fe-S protein assembly co-chaperone HscB [Orbaceae bacterium ESL0727]